MKCKLDILLMLSHNRKTDVMEIQGQVGEVLTTIEVPFNQTLWDELDAVLGQTDPVEFEVKE